jgi:D-lactate dehydrogenase (cytochrome)
MNELRPEPLAGEPPECPAVRGREPILQAYSQYLQDESRLRAPQVEAIYFPRTAEEAAAAVLSALRAGHRLAVSGGRTGITGAAVPIGAEEVLSLDRIKPRPSVHRAPDGRWCVRVGAGTTVAELADALAHGLCDYPDGKPDRPLYYPVDTTETSAQLGGTIATNASGARTYHYGPTRCWVERLRLVTADGRLLELRRGQVRAQDGLLLWRRPDGSAVELRIPDLAVPRTKHTAGYYLRADMDAVDLFVGSEGTLGIVVEADLLLAVRPANRLFLIQFVPDAHAAVRLALACRRRDGLAPLAIEYIGPRAMALLRSLGRQTPAYLEVSRLPADAEAACYLEFAFADEPDLDRIYRALTVALEGIGLDPARSWAGFGERDMEEMKRLRHAVPETVNAIIARRQAQVPELHKVGTDMAVPVEALEEMLAFYERRLEQCGLEFVLFGHVGDGHLHVNILPRAADEVQRGESLYVEFAQEAVRLGGSVAGEHGIGRIKKKFLPLQHPPEAIEAMRAVRRTLDPAGLLNPGVLFD